MSVTAKAKQKPPVRTASKGGVQKKKTPPNSKKLTVTFSQSEMEELSNYLAETGYGKEEFVKNAVNEKISRDKISKMIDSVSV